MENIDPKYAKGNSPDHIVEAYRIGVITQDVAWALYTAKSMKEDTDFDKYMYEARVNTLNKRLETALDGLEKIHKPLGENYADELFYANEICKPGFFGKGC